eukprot:gene8913-6249_t
MNFQGRRHRVVGEEGGSSPPPPPRSSEARFSVPHYLLDGGVGGVGLGLGSTLSPKCYLSVSFPIPFLTPRTERYGRRDKQTVNVFNTTTEGRRRRRYFAILVSAYPTNLVPLDSLRFSFLCFILTPASPLDTLTTTDNNNNNNNNNNNTKKEDGEEQAAAAFLDLLVVTCVVAPLDIYIYIYISHSWETKEAAASGV